MAGRQVTRIATPLALPAGIQSFGKYFLTERIGAGGMAEVFRAVTAGPEGFQRVMVVKRILPTLSQDQSFVRMFVEEAKITALLSHPNIVQVHEFGVQDGAYFLAMEHVHGRDLATIAKLLTSEGRLLAPAIAVDIARQVGLGLDYAHRLTGSGGRPLRIIHRDVSPANIMVGFNSAVKLLDFGLAHAVHARESTSNDGMIRGKVSYLAPEQLVRGEIDHRADIFGLGVVLHETLTGRRLFQGDDDLQSLRMVTEKPIPPPSSFNAGVSPRLDRIVLRALERDRARRYHSAGEMVSDLEQCLLEARHTSQTLPRLMQALFGAQAASTHELSVPPELIAIMLKVTEDSSGVRSQGAAATATGTARRALPARARDSADAPESVVLEADPFGLHRPGAGFGRSRQGRRTTAVAVLAAAVLAAVGLGAYFFVTGGGNRDAAARRTNAVAPLPRAPGVVPLGSPKPAPPAETAGTPSFEAPSRPRRRNGARPAAADRESTAAPSPQTGPPPPVAAAATPPAPAAGASPVEEGHAGAVVAEPNKPSAPPTSKPPPPETVDPFE